MKLYYEFIVKQQEQLITLSHRAVYIRRYQEKRFSAWGRFVHWCGDAFDRLRFLDEESFHFSKR